MNYKKRILFVDDEPHFLDGLKRMLRSQRLVWDMVFVTSVDEARKEIDLSLFNAIITDYNMPIKNGFDLLKYIRNTKRTQLTPVIFLTGNGEADIKRRALDEGATDLLNKPVQMEDLLARIRSALRIQEYQEKLKAQSIMLERELENQVFEMESVERDTVYVLVKAGEFRDDGTGKHVIRVGHYSRIIASALGLPDDFVMLLSLASPLHDIGKIGIPDAIVKKDTKLTQAEKKLMEEHCRIGKEILSGAPKELEFFNSRSGNFPQLQQTTEDTNRILEAASRIAMTHHERWDGTGYPQGLAGEAIPIESRIVALGDVYDALRSPKPYKPEFDHAATVEMMAKEAGKHFDPQIYKVFDRVQNQIKEIWDNYPDE